MDVCVFGAGAVGGYLAGHLIDKMSASETSSVSVVARGAHLHAMEKNGLRIISSHREIIAIPTRLTQWPSELPPHDIVFVTLKANALAACALDIAKLLKPSGHAVFVVNGIPWWWNHGLSHTGRLPLLDPSGELWAGLTPERTLGCVVYSPNEVINPGVVRHAGHDHWLLGEPDRSCSERLGGTVQLLRDSGLNAHASADIRRDIWAKLLRNTPLNTVCALTRLSVDRLVTNPAIVTLIDVIIDEIVRIAQSLGWDIHNEAMVAQQAPRMGGALNGPPVFGLKPSMLQDVIAGRPMEVDAIVGQVQAFAQEANVSCPTIDSISALLKGLQSSI